MGLWCCASAFPFVALVSAATEPTSIWKTTTKRALITTVDHPAREALLPPMLSSLHPRLFRGVTPYRHDGESLSCMQGMACTFRLPAGPCTKEPPDRYRRMCHTPDAFTPGSALRHLSNDKATNGREWGALSCCVYQKGNNLSSKGQYTTTNKSYVVKLVII